MQISSGLVALLVAACVAPARAEDLGIRQLPASLAIDAAATALAVPVAATANPSAAALPIEQRWTLTAGQTIGHNLKSWAARSNWNIVWQLPKDWVVPAAATFSGSFPDAAAHVIETLASNGALIRAQIFEGNKTIVISGPGVAQQ